MHEATARTNEAIAKIVKEFEQKYMGMNPKSVEVDIHESHILVTLTEVTSVAERECAGDEARRGRIERLWSEAFDTVKTHLQAAVSEACGRPILSVRLSVDSLDGDAILNFKLAHPCFLGSSDRS